MKKVLKSFALTGSMLAIAATAQAANTAQVTLTSPAIVKSGCERVGSYTLTFDPGTVLEEGDWFYMDLPAGTSICNTIDYMIASGRTVGDETETITYPSAASLPVNSNADLSVGMVAFPGVGIGASVGPWTNNVVSGIGVATPAAGLVFRVYAPATGRRVWVYVYGTTAGADSLTLASVAPTSSLTMHLLDGQAYNTFVAMNNAGTNTGGVAGLATVWGDVTTDDIGLNDGVAYIPAHNVPFVENTLCVNAEQMSGDLMFTSFNSLNNFLTFTGDSQLAHVAAGNVVSLIACSGKTTKPVSGNILIGSQNACTFNYETMVNYCPTNTANPFSGNRMLINGASTFGDPGDRYDMTVTSNTAGVYFGSNLAVVQGFTPGQTTDTDCAGAGAAIATAFTIGNAGVTAYDAGTCAVATNKRVTSLTTGSGTAFVGAITGINTYDTLYVDLPGMVYDTSIVGNGVEANVSVNLIKYPCGPNQAFTRTIGTFVTTCPTAAPTVTTTLLYPFLPAMDGSMTGWWGGFTIVNAGSTAGTCTLAFTDAEGDTASYTTPSIAAAGQWNAGATATLLTNLTAGTGNVGDANVAIVATCNFSRGGGFAFTGNGEEGTGYTAYVLSGNSWQ